MAQDSDPARSEHGPDGAFRIGQRIRQLRGRRLTQRELAERAEVTIDALRSYEQGRRRPSITNLHAIARALDVDIADLLAKPRTLHGDGEHSGALAIRQALTSVDDLLGDDPEIDQPLTVVDGRRALAFAWGAYWAGNYDQLGEQLPGAIGRARATVRAVRAADRGEAADLAAQTLQVAASTLVHLGYTDVAHLALRQALGHAVHAADPLREHAMRSSIAWVLLVEGRWNDSARLAAKVAEAVTPSERDPLQQWSLYGSLLLSSATALGRAGDRETALTLVDDADRVAGRTGHRTDYEVHFGPDQATMQRVDVETVTKHYGPALDAARRMPRDTPLPLAARARHLSDVALAQTELGRDDKATDTLETIAAMAPTWARFQTQPQMIYDQLRERAANPPRLVRLGQKLGRVS
jgi:transcriptional regulator with XRE-family HTH domain